MIKPKIRMLDLYNVQKYLYRSLIDAEVYTFSYFQEGDVIGYGFGTSEYHTFIDKYLKHLSKKVLK